MGRVSRGGWRRSAPVRAGRVRRRALGALQLGHHRAAQGDRPRARRDPPRVAEAAEPPRRPPGRRSAVLVHDDRLDDVELRRRRPLERGVDRALRRQSRVSRPGCPLAPCGGSRDHDVRSLGELHRSLHEGRRRPACRAGSLPAAGGRIDGLPPLARRLRLGLRAPGARPVALLDLRRHRPLHRVRRRRPHAAGLPRRAPGTRARRQGRGVERGREARRRRGRGASDHRADALDAAPPLGRPRRLALPGELLRDVPRNLAPRRLDRAHRARDGDHQRPLRRDDQPRRRANGHRRDLPGDARRRRGRRRARRRSPPPRHPGIHAALRRPPRRGRARRRPRLAHPDEDPKGLLPTSRPRRGACRPRDPAHALGQGARGARQADPLRRAHRTDGQPRRARQPRRASPFEELARSAEWSGE